MLGNLHVRFGVGVEVKLPGLHHGPAGTLSVLGDMTIASGSLLEFRADGASPFRAGTHTLFFAGAIDGKFNVSHGLGGYVDGDGLVYSDNVLKLKVEKDLHPGDANLDTQTDVRDFNLWNANKFQSGTDWGTGDFNGDGITDVRDFNQWNAAKFTAAWDKSPATEGQVPDPGVLVLLAAGLLGIGVGRWWRRRSY